LKLAVLLQVIYGLYRVGYLWKSFSGWHIAGAVAMVLTYLGIYRFLSSAAATKHAPLSQVR